MTSVSQEDYIRQLLGESFHSESGLENLANDSPDEDELDYRSVSRKYQYRTRREG